MPDGLYAVSDIQDYIEYIIKRHESSTRIPSIHVYIDRINSRLVFKIEDGRKLEQKTSETMELLGSPKKLIDKTQNGENVPSLEVFDIVLDQCNLLDNQY